MSAFDQAPEHIVAVKLCGVPWPASIRREELDLCDCGQAFGIGGTKRRQTFDHGFGE
jgi:hypothetical protein